ncbi:hypothetical protein F5878DRAFT_659611 [Lentinula raphanica]|uniref:Uncharacterized protein n=1 Tax=Lentinula raphanica TaxID=153919 RepID=A0AA38UGF5_9AGAR|nr:hypothetical protein F5878DRAFT_659611 [Lentinula raphanica]
MSGHWSPLLASGSSSSFAIPKHEISPHESSEPFKIYSNIQIEMRRKLGVLHDTPFHFLAGGAVPNWRTDEEKHGSYILVDYFFFPINSAGVYTDELRCDVKGTHRRQEFDMGKDDFPILDSGAFKMDWRIEVRGGDTLTVVAPAFTIHVDT